MTFSAWCVHIVLSVALLAAIAGGCVKVDRQHTAQTIDSSALAAQVVDSMAIYRCDTCAFAVAYRKQTNGLVKPCPTCDWVALNPKVTNNKGDVPELTNRPVDPLAEQDALQHNTVHILAVSDSTEQAGESIARRAKHQNDGQ